MGWFCVREEAVAAVVSAAEKCTSGLSQFRGASGQWTNATSRRMRRTFSAHERTFVGRLALFHMWVVVFCGSIRSPPSFTLRRSV